MPTDSKGKFHMNRQVMARHEKMAGYKAGKPGDDSVGTDTQGADNENMHDPEEQMEEKIAPGIHEQVAEHLQNMHDQTGHAHSHIEHHPDGSHTTHHISHDGEMHEPVHHPDTNAMMEHHAGLHGEGQEY